MTTTNGKNHVLVSKGDRTQSNPARIIQEMSMFDVSTTAHLDRFVLSSSVVVAHGRATIEYITLCAINRVRALECRARHDAPISHRHALCGVYPDDCIWKLAPRCSADDHPEDEEMSTRNDTRAAGGRRIPAPNLIRVIHG